MDDRPMKKARMLAEIASIQKQAKVLAVQKNRGAHYEPVSYTHLTLPTILRV